MSILNDNMLFQSTKNTGEQPGLIRIKYHIHDTISMQINDFGVDHSVPLAGHPLHPSDVPHLGVLPVVPEGFPVGL